MPCLLAASLVCSSRGDPRGDRERVVAGARTDLEDALAGFRLKALPQALVAETGMGPLDEEALAVGERRGMGSQPRDACGQEREDQQWDQHRPRHKIG